MAALITISIVQTVWWYLDQSSYSANVVADRRASFERDERAASRLLERGEAWPDVQAIYPHLELVDGTVRVLDSLIEDIERARQQRVIMYGSEWTFFVLVLMGGLAVIWKALRDQARLRYHQENFLTLVSHEFKTPIASMMLNIENMQRHPPSGDSLLGKLDRLKSDLNRMRTMVSNILESARLQEGSLELRDESTNVRDIFNNALGRLHSEGRDIGLHIEDELPDKLIIQADAIACESVVRNVLDNAFEAVRQVRDPTIKISAKSEPGSVTVTIADNGIGFTSDQTKSLFEKFYRTDETYSGDRKGTGLGLFIVRQVMAMERGSVRAHSDGPNQGAAFSLTWRTPPSDGSH